ncbi:hypothetical protein CIPAW_16G063500 [Carya illinoinensis]|uniref:Uncharacterized protein n=1 Tax=Carya illinoinensis TaxID=32201 RepID=A0A8T1N4J6_CARIL|nr:hypothetical protein CIPAW_16G063500 [Carya illinoinensis]
MKGNGRASRERETQRGRVFETQRGRKEWASGPRGSSKIKKHRGKERQTQRWRKEGASASMVFESENTENEGRGHTSFGFSKSERSRRKRGGKLKKTKKQNGTVFNFFTLASFE